MNRDTLKKIVTVTLLNQFHDGDAAEKAEAIAAQLDIFATVMGDGAPAGAPAPLTGFPAVNPEAMAPSMVVPPVERYDAPPPTYDPKDLGNLIIPAGAVGVAKGAPEPPASPVRSVRQSAAGSKPPAGKISVPELNQLIQDNTPRRLTVEVPMEDGGTKRVFLDRDVLSRHVEEAVQLIYFPPGTMQSQREFCQIQAVISIDDLPVNLQTVLDRIKADAARALAPRGEIVSVPPRLKLGAVQPRTAYEDGSPSAVQGQDLDGNQAAFNSLPPVSA